MNADSHLSSPSNARSERRYSCYSDLAVAYEGYCARIPVRVPDLSACGMFINVLHHLPEGAILNVRFRLTRLNHPVEVRAEVRYCLPGVGIGIEFIGISPADREAIAQELCLAG